MAVDPINDLLTALNTLYTSTPALNTVFGWYREVAVENAPLPYCVVVVAGATGASYYQPGTTTDATIRFVMYAADTTIGGTLYDGETAAANAIAPLIEALEGTILTLPNGHMTNVVRDGDVIPRRIARDPSTADSATQGNMWSKTVTYRYSLAP